MWAVVVVDKVGATVVGQVSDPTRLKGGQKGAEGDAVRANGTAERVGEGSKNRSRGEGEVEGREGDGEARNGGVSSSNKNNRESLTPPPLATLTRHCCSRDGRGWSSWMVHASEVDGCWERMEEWTNCSRSIGSREMRRHLGRSTHGMVGKGRNKE